jgi:hypothetical protein
MDSLQKRRAVAQVTALFLYISGKGFSEWLSENGLPVW